MKRPNQILIALGAVVLTTACSRHEPEQLPEGAAILTESSLKSTPSKTQLAAIGESVPVKGNQVWLKKQTWIGKKIWLSLGVERASVTGLATSVIGYIPATIERDGAMLVLKRNNTGLYGGSALGPEIGINAYPIVGESDDAVLVDIASPKTAYGLSTAGMFGGDDSSTELSPRFEYLKSIKLKKHSLSFDIVTTVKSATPLFDPTGDSAEAMAGLDPFMLSMTLRTDWVVPTESPKFTPLKADDSIFGFFLSPKLVIDGGSDTEAFVNRIDTSKSFEWEMTSNTPKEFQDALSAGIRAWNTSLGGDVLKVKLGEQGKDVTDPSASNVVWDDNLAVGMAFANWRSNPYTGEIVQAQVYMSGNMWAQNAELTYKLRQLEKKIRDAQSSANPSDAMKALATKTDVLSEVSSLQKDYANMQKVEKSSARRLFVGFNTDIAAEKAKSKAFCQQGLESSDIKLQLDILQSLAELPDLGADSPAAPVVQEDHMPYPADNLSVDMFKQNVLRAVVMHEVGHTLGLRHNFLGSTGTSKNGTIPTASIMDYNDLVVAAQLDGPGDSDKAILDMGYKGIPTQVKFCTDEQAAAGMPDCTPFDFSSDAVNSIKVQQESALMLAQLLISAGHASSGIGMVVNALTMTATYMNYIYAPTVPAMLALNDVSFPDRQQQAWNDVQAAKQMLGLPFDANLQNTFSNLITVLIASRATPDAAQSSLYDSIQKELSEALVNADGKRDLATREAALAGLQKLQDARARQAIKDAQTTIQARMNTTPNASVDQSASDEETVGAITRMMAAGYFVAKK